MTLRTIITVFVCLLTISTVFSQGLHLDINDYVTPDFTLQELEFLPSISLTSLWSSEGTDNDDSSSLRGSLVYNIDQFNRKVIRNIFFRLNGIGETIDNQNNRNLTITLSSNQSFYLTEKLFIELSPRVFHLRRSGNQDINNLTNARLETGIGFGRRELITPVWKAKYIIQELLKSQGLDNIYSNENIVEVANELLKYQKTRVFDSRFKSIYEIENLSSFILEKFPEFDPSPSFFVLLNDWYRFENNSQRLSGNTWTLRYTNEFVENGDLNGFIHSLSVVHTRSKAIGDNNQIDLNAAIIGSFTNFFISPNEELLHLDVGLSYRYLFDIRTNLSISTGFTTADFEFFLPVILSDSNFRFDVAFNKFFSARSRLNASFGYRNLFSRDTRSFRTPNTISRLSISISYLYSIF